VVAAIGAHVSVARGLLNAVPNARAAKCGRSRSGSPAPAPGSRPSSTPPGGATLDKAAVIGEAGVVVHAGNMPVA
jgi:hypothetical protein